MDFLNGLFLIIAGLGVMAFGLMIFYAMLPLFYAFFGYGVGYWLGSLVTSVAPGEFSLVKLLFAIGGAILFALAAYLLEPQSEDGFCTWNFLDDELAVGKDVPVLRFPKPLPGL